MARLRYAETFTGGFHYPAGPLNPQPPQPAPPAGGGQDPAKLRRSAVELRRQAQQVAQPPDEDFARAAELTRQAEELERQAAAIQPPPNPNPPVLPVGGNPCGGVINRDEDLVMHLWYWVLTRLVLPIGGLAFLAWLVFGVYQWGFHANPSTPPCNSAAPPPSQDQKPSPVSSKSSSEQSDELKKELAELRSAMEKAMTNQPRPATVAQPPVDPTPVERGLSRLADTLPALAPPPKPELKRILSDEERARRSWEAWMAPQNAR